MKLARFLFLSCQHTSCVCVCLIAGGRVYAGATSLRTSFLKALGSTETVAGISCEAIGRLPLLNAIHRVAVCVN